MGARAGQPPRALPRRQPPDQHLQEFPIARFPINPMAGACSMLRRRSAVSTPILLAIAGAREYTSPVPRLAQGSSSLSVATFRKSAVSIAVLAPISLACAVSSAALQQPPAARHAPATAAGPAQPLPAQCLHPANATETLAQLLDTIAGHPTAGAFTTLGAVC